MCFSCGSVAGCRLRVECADSFGGRFEAWVGEVSALDELVSGLAEFVVGLTQLALRLDVVDALLGLRLRAFKVHSRAMLRESRHNGPLDAKGFHASRRVRHAPVIAE